MALGVDVQCISLVGRDTLLAGVVGTCVSTVGVAISDVVLSCRRCPTTRLRRLVSSLSCDVGTNALRLRRIVSRSVLTKYARDSGVRLAT